MQTIQQLIKAIAESEIHLYNITREQTDGGEIVTLHYESMQHEHVLWATISIPGEVASQYDLSC